MKQRRSRVSPLAGFLLLLAAVGPLTLVPYGASPARAAVAADAASVSLAEIDAFVEGAMKDWEVPGLALAVVRDGEVLLARGYGVRAKGKTDPVDADTLFAIGSSSKAFTAACIGLLVDQKKLAWDDRVTRYLPGFELNDAYATRALTVRDLLTHRSGLARGDSLWYSSGFERAEILRRVRELPPSWGFRERFGYQNIMFLAAGELYARVAGESWDDCIAKRFFAPLGMKRSTTSVDPLPTIENVATPHEQVEDAVMAVPWYDLDSVAPAGSINSSAREMAAWVKLQLARGRGPGGEQVLSEAVVAETRTPQMVVRKEGPWARYFPGSRFITYGLGWFVDDYRGEVVVEHGGSIDGMRALVSMMPERGLGLVVLTNRGGQLLPEALRYRVYDTLLEGVAGVAAAAEKDWNADLLAAVEKTRSEERAAREKTERERVAGTKPSLALAAYAGEYEHTMYGVASVGVENGALVLGRGDAIADLEHWHFDTFRARFRNRLAGAPLVTFQLDAAGHAAELAIPELGSFSARANPPDRQ